ncbi:MAG: M28 family peptidase [bacterium]
MRLVLIAFALAGLLFAGCSQPTPSTTTEPPALATPEYPTVAPTFKAATLLSDLKTFATQFPVRNDNVPTHEGARQWIAQQWRDAGLTVWRQNFTTGGLPQANIVGIKWGEDRSTWIVVGGHYDTTHWDCIVDSNAPGPATCAGHAASQGAYDDGSGTMMSVELGKRWANVTTPYTVAFVTYDGEERGLEGASAFVDVVASGASPYGNVTIRGALDIDMFGITWPGTNAPVQILDNSNALHKVFKDTQTAIGMPADMYYCGDMLALGSSDFQVFFDQDIPVVFFSSDFGKYSPPGSPAAAPEAYYPNWHFIDTYDTMQAEAGGAPQLEAGFTTAVSFATAELHALADTTVALDVHAPPGSSGLNGNQQC